MTSAGAAVPRLSVQRLQPAEAPHWEAFLQGSCTGTLFHDLRFLAYHPEGRHDFHHLVFRQAEEIVALLPGGLRAEPEGVVFASPVGAAIGGFVLGPDCRLELALRLVEALQAHAAQAGWARIEITVPPPIYNGRLAALPSFALSRSGFALADRQACFVLRLQPKRAGGYADFFRTRAARNLRAARRDGATVLRGDGERLLPRFLPLREETFARHGSPPTHSREELALLASRFADRMTFHVTEQHGVTTGGTCLLGLNRLVTSALYTCTADAHAREHGVLVAIADAIEDLAARGVEWYDLGPSAGHQHINAGVVLFKEGLGAEYHLRESWSWPARAGGDGALTGLAAND